jgi:tRNA dimethylallyltransferase
LNLNKSWICNKVLITKEFQKREDCLPFFVVNTRDFMQKYAILISGATASGKTDFAIKIARKLSGEIINGDIGSMYTPLTIGTAKPDWQSSDIPHHLFDILDSPVNFTVVQFRERVKVLIHEIWQRGNVPIIVGGSAFYIKSFFFKQHEIEGTQELVQQMEEEMEQGLIDCDALWNKLAKIDPVRASQIHGHDAYRIMRAIAIFQATGQKPSAFEQLFEPLAPFYFITCVRDRIDLYQRINQRVGEMIEQGWLEEIEELRGTDWESFLLSKKLIGYDDLLKSAVVLDLQALQDVAQMIAQKTRNYAKRQIIFLNKLQSEIAALIESGHCIGAVEEINLTLCDVGLYIKGLSNRILQTLS